jgi:transketolase
MRIGEKAGLPAGTRQMRDAFGAALVEAARMNPRVVALDGDLSSSTGMAAMRKAYPERFFNIGIAEANLIGVSAGFAASGFIPFVGSLPSFLLPNAFDQLRLQVSIASLNVKLLGSHAGISTGREGPTSMSIEDMALVGALPPFVILVPSDESMMSAAVKAAVEHVGPVYIRSSRGEFPRVYGERGGTLTIGHANRLREGRDLTIIACGMMTGAALDAAAILAEGGITVRVLDMHTVKPVDRAAVLAAARETGAILTAEEHLVRGGLGAAVAQAVCQACPVPMRFIGIPDTYLGAGSVEELMELHGFSTAHIVKAAADLARVKADRARPGSGARPAKPAAAPGKRAAAASAGPARRPAKPAPKAAPGKAKKAASAKKAPHRPASGKGKRR